MTMGISGVQTALQKYLSEIGNKSYLLFFAIITYVLHFFSFLHSANYDRKMINGQLLTQICQVLRLGQKFIFQT